MASIVVVLGFWTFVLFVLKFRGAEVGCASGRAFLTKQTGEEASSTDEDNDSFSSEESRGASQQNSVAKLIGRKDSLGNFHSADTEGDAGPPTDPMTKVDDGSFDNASATATLSPQINPRERRTRFCFLFFSLTALVCVPIILVTSSGELKKAAETSHEPVLVSDSTLCTFDINVITSMPSFSVSTGDFGGRRHIP